MSSSVRWLPRRPVAVVLAVFLVLVPTAFTVFPHWGMWSLGVRIPVIGSWILAAAIAGWTTVLQSERVEALAAAPVERRDKLREVAAARLLRALLLPESSGFPNHYEFRLFVEDRASGRMVPAFESTGIADSEGWKRGQGATGLAWNANNRVLLRGRAVYDSTYGLTPSQQARYRDLAVVASMPVRTARDRVIAVLSVSSSHDDRFLDTPGALLAHLELAEVAGRILVDILGQSRE
jgi:hypothetical protein